MVLLSPANAGAVLALDAAPGLTRLGDTRGALLWRVEPPAGSALARPARAVVVGPDGAAELALPFAADAVHAQLPPGAAGRRVVLAERYDPGRRATLDGVALTPSVEHGWAQGFVLPAAGGRLEVTRADGRLALTLPGRGAALAVTLLLALPLPRRRGRWAPPPPPRPSRPVPRPAPAPDDLRPAAVPRVYDDDEHPEDAARPLYVGPPLRRLRRRRLLRRMARRLLRRPGRRS